MRINFNIKITALFCCTLMLACCNSSKSSEQTQTNNKECKITTDTIGQTERDLLEVMQRNEAVGLAVVAVKDGKVIYNKSLGYKDLENKTPMGETDVLRIASISKSFTTIGILQLMEQGKLELDTDVSDIMGFKIRNPKYPETPITVRMLLSHISSMSDSNGYFTLNKLNPDSSSTWQKAWNDYAPGTKYQYCNLGFNTLGAILEKVSGERFDKYILNHIIKPLGLYASFNVMDLDSTKLINLYSYNRADSSYTKSQAYTSPEKDLENYKLGYSTPLFSPTGGMKISALDLAKVMMMHMNMGTLDKVRILDYSSSALMQSKITPTNYDNEYYGMGIITTDNLLKGHTLTGHDGLALGAYTAMYWDKKANYGFVIVTNGCNGNTEYDFANILCESAECLYKNLIKE